MVPNRYPIAAPSDNLPAPSTEDRSLNSAGSLFPSAPFNGRHEVVIECPDSRSRLLDLSVTEILRILIAWRERSRALIAERRYRTLAVYRNEGFSAGASLPHCHSQILAASRLSQLDQIRVDRADTYRRQYQRELLADLLAAERQSGIRLIAETDHLTVLCPFAPRSAWHVRFAPRLSHAAFLDSAEDELLQEISVLLPKVLSAIEATCGGHVAMNIIVSQPPVDRPPHGHGCLNSSPAHKTGRLGTADRRRFLPRPTGNVGRIHSKAIGNPVELVMASVAPTYDLI
ncbi:MAG UNVERIFIED_CONTAM: hypothetical protein LVR18_31890 [Planctomycetaceae bacterium]